MGASGGGGGGGDLGGQGGGLGGGRAEPRTGDGRAPAAGDAHSVAEALRTTDSAEAAFLTPLPTSLPATARAVLAAAAGPDGRLLVTTANCG